ncbi:MAG: ATP-dependent RNA helicase RhlE, partial [Gemmatimonadota bacterium]
PDDYVHRVGRTARGDDTGDAVTLVSPSDWLALREIETLTGEPIARDEIAGFEPSVPPPAARREGDRVDPAERPRSALSRGIRKR